MAFILTILAVLIVVVGSEIWWRRQDIHGEFSRKFVHITVGSFVAFWPFFLSWGQIQFLSVAFLVAVLLSRYFNVFKAIHTVQRPTWGEVFFAMAVGIIALMTHDKWIYAAALLQMGLADGMAAVVGIHHPGRYKYSVFGHAKSLSGTTAFFVVSVLIFVVIGHYSDMPLSLAWIVGVSALGSILENIAIIGLDNLLVPVMVAFLLTNM